MLRLAIVLVVGLWAAACAARPPQAVVVPVPPRPDINAADRLVDEGCYACLQEAFRIYEAAADSAKQFSTALLLAMREKELGLDAAPWVDRARLWATPESTTYLDIVSAIPWTAVAVAADFDVPRPPVERVEEWQAFLARPGSNTVLDAYLRLALTCSRPGGVASSTMTGGACSTAIPAGDLRRCAAGQTGHRIRRKSALCGSRVLPRAV
jgi:hypothetical protein